MDTLPAWCPPYNTKKKDLDTGEDVYCICKKPDNGDLMVGCDGCDDWFHFECLKISPKFKELVFSFYCPYCQAGITGPGSITPNRLPKTIWKRKCRLVGCYKECAKDSKYCCKEHGEKYMCTLWERVRCKDKNPSHVVKKMLSASESVEALTNIGKGPIPTASIDRDPVLYNKLVANDSSLIDLNRQLDKINAEEKPQVEQQIGELNRYLEWLKEVNGRLFASEDDAKVKSKPKSRRKKIGKQKSMCGYKPDYQIPCSMEDFVSEYDEEATIVHGVCCKLRCSRHADWSGVLSNGFEFQMQTLQTSIQRLQLLVRVRQSQLNMQFYERRTARVPY